MVEQNQPVPQFQFNATNGVNGKLADYAGKNLVLYFYPKDNTPGCTMESKAFRDLSDKFTDSNTVIFGVSRDSLPSHEKFKSKLELPFELIADTDSVLCNLFDVIKPKSMFGKKYKGIERSTFVIDSKGILRGVWRNVKIAKHAEEIFKFIKEI